MGLIIKWDNDQRVPCLMQILFAFPQSLLTNRHKRDFIHAIKNIKSSSSVHFESLQKFYELDKSDRRYALHSLIVNIPFVGKILASIFGVHLASNSIEEIIQILVNKIKRDSLRIRINDDVFEKAHGEPKTQS